MIHWIHLADVPLRSDVPTYSARSLQISQNWLKSSCRGTLRLGAEEQPLELVSLEIPPKCFCAFRIAEYGLRISGGFGNRQSDCLL